MKRHTKPSRVYVDTSVVGGCFDEEFSACSNALFEEVRHGNLVLVISDTTLAELSGAPPRVQEVLAALSSTELEYIQVDDEVDELAEEYLRQAVLPMRMLPDALHIAAATVARVDVLVSWNFKHIVNLDRIHAFNAVNLRTGYPLLEIRSPREVLAYDDENI